MSDGCLGDGCSGHERVHGMGEEGEYAGASMHAAAELGRA
jgi:hypothetical protein